MAKTKVFPRSEYVTVFIIIFVGISSFGLGRLSVGEHLSSPVMENVEREVQRIPTLQHSGFVVASKSGTKYHFPWCSGARRIKEENKITFQSTEEARTSGYLPASNCKGLD